MNLNLSKSTDYHSFIQEIKQRIQSAQIKAAVTVNYQLLRLYWELAEQITVKQKETSWGDGFITQMSNDLKHEFPEMKGFSKRNLELMRQWYRFWSDDPVMAKQAATQTGMNLLLRENPPLIFQIPWWHNVVIISKIKKQDEALFYVQKTIQNNWSRAMLTHQIESDLFHRERQAITNFHQTLPQPQSDLARETLKDPYYFDFLSL